MLELSAQLSEDGKVEDFKFNGEKIEIKEKAISFTKGTDSKGGKWTSCKKFCKSCTLGATLWLKETAGACQCACFETRTEYAADKSYTIYFRECQF